jgi:hypothetical protein
MSHIYREKTKMLTLRLFNDWVHLLSSRPADKDLATWARIEYKKDSLYAYHHMLEHGVAPGAGAR